MGFKYAYKKIGISVIICLSLLHSCEKSNVDVNYCILMDRSTGPVPFTTFAELSNDSINCYPSTNEYASWSDPVFYVINDQQALDTLIECSSYNFDFNFEDYTLLIGYFYTEYGPAELSEQEVELECGFSTQYLRYEVTAELEDNDGNQNTLIQHNVIVPKIPDGMEVRHFAIRHKLYLKDY